MLFVVVSIATAGARNRLGWCSNLCSLWWSQLQVLVLEIASAGAQNRFCWCSKSPPLVLKIASAGAPVCAPSGGPNCKCWCSKSPRLLVLKLDFLWWSQLQVLVLEIGPAGAQNRLGWCSKSPRLVLKIASAGARNRLGWCSKCYAQFHHWFFKAKNAHFTVISPKFASRKRTFWCFSVFLLLVLKFLRPLVVPIASAGAQNRLGWCSKSPPLVLKIASAGAQNRLGWCSDLCFLWWSQLQVLVLEIASVGAQNRLGWCSKSPPLVLKIASAGAQNRLGWCSNLCFLWCLFSCTLRPNHIWIFCPLCALLSKLCHFFHGLRFTFMIAWVAKSLRCLVHICKLVIAFVTVVQKL